MIGTTLDKYEVLQKVGEGGMATVYRGRHSTLNRDVAIKVLHPHLSSSARNRMRFAREAKAVERLRHDNILEIFDYSGDEANDCYIVTEFVEGETLTSLLHRCGRLPSEVVAIVGIHVTRALAFAHDNGILHRDLKTDNVMVRVDGTVKLMDFGIARFLDESHVTMTGALVGSPAFMSPEQAIEAELDLRSDLFALGTVLFYLVTGHLPFSGSNPSLILKNVIEGNRPNVSELTPTMSASLADVIERLMATSPDDRYVTASDVERHLSECLSEARIDLSAPDWHLTTFLDDPESYEARLEAHLQEVLVIEGTRLLEEGDHLAALRLFNRLLSMDEDNAEVLALVQNLHGDPVTPSRRGAWIAAGALLVFSVALLSLWLIAQRPVEPTVEPAPPELPLPSLGSLEPPQSQLPALPSPEPMELPEPPAAPAPVQRPQPTQRPEPAGDDEAIRPRPAPAGAGQQGGGQGTAEGSAGSPEAEVPPAPVESDFGTVVIKDANGYNADVYLRGKRIGQTHSDLILQVGDHELQLRSRLLYDHTLGVTVSPGEKQVVSVLLKVRPTQVIFPGGWDADCRVIASDATHQGEDVGSLEQLGWSWRVDHPDKRVEIQLSCGGKPAASKVWRVMSGAEVRFPDVPHRP